MKTVLLSIGLLAGLVSTGLGLLFRYAPQDNSDAGALASFISVPFLAVGVLILVLCLLGLVL